MPDPSETTPQAGESAAPTTTPTVNTAQAAAESAQAASSTTTDESISLQEAKKLRKEAKGLRERLAESEGKVRELETAKLSETERTKQERDEALEKAKKLEGRLPEVITHYAVELAAQKFGVVDPEVVARLIDRSELEYDKDGLPTNVDEVVKGLIESKPYLRAPQAATTPPPASAGNTANPQSTQTASLRIKSVDDWAKADKTQLFKAIREGTYPRE